MNKNGMHLSIEALLSLILLAIILCIPLEEQKSSFEELAIMQKQHDLLFVWAKTGERNLAEMKKDFLFVFPEKCGCISLAQKRVFIETCISRGKNNLSENAIVFNEELKPESLIIEVFY
jgi:hypothetical protein